jgi:hypothetical protein
MRISRPFDPLAPGEYDNFAFDFTADIGAAAIASTSWTCAVKTAAPGGVVDPAPQSHVIAAYVQTQIGSGGGPLTFPVQPDVAVLLTGAFSVARIGGFLPGQAGATYTLAATAVTSDGRTLTLSADLPIGQS